MTTMMMITTEMLSFSISHPSYPVNGSPNIGEKWKIHVILTSVRKSKNIWALFRRFMKSTSQLVNMCMTPDPNKGSVIYSAHNLFMEFNWMEYITGLEDDSNGSKISMPHLQFPWLLITSTVMIDWLVDSNISWAHRRRYVTYSVAANMHRLNTSNCFALFAFLSSFHIIPLSWMQFTNKQSWNVRDQKSSPMQAIIS